MSISDIADLGFLPEVAERVHAARNGDTDSGHEGALLDVLWWRKFVDGSPLARHIAAVRDELYNGGTSTDPTPAREPGWTFDPDLELTRLKAHSAQTGPTSVWTRACVEMTEKGRSLLEEIHRIRLDDQAGDAVSDDARGQTGRRVWRQRVTVGDDPVGAIVRRAREGANAGRTTKSTCPPCRTAVWAAVMEEFGLRGVAAFPPVMAGSWWMALFLHDVQDWRADYISILDYSFYFEYNMDSAPFGGERPGRLFEEIMRIWDMPDLPADLRLRRAHMACNMVYFDTKRRYEANWKRTDGLTGWVHGDRDQLRDFIAIDFGGPAHYLSYAEGTKGRNDMMLCRLVNDWIDMGPDLRNEECNQGALALTRGSVTMPDLLECYKRIVWMLNTELHSDERYVGLMVTMTTCLWQTCDHRHDVWRYYALAYELCSVAESLDLYKECEIADCYTSELIPTEPSAAPAFSVCRRPLRYRVEIAGRMHTGSVELHASLCDAVENGLFPASVVEFEYVVPLLLRRGEISAPDFLTHMDSVYCDNFAALMRSAHVAHFSRAYGMALAALAMEQWWTGINFAFAVGSLIEAQPGHVAADRDH